VNGVEDSMCNSNANCSYHTMQPQSHYANVEVLSLSTSTSKHRLMRSTSDKSPRCPVRHQRSNNDQRTTATSGVPDTADDRQQRATLPRIGRDQKAESSKRTTATDSLWCPTIDTDILSPSYNAQRSTEKMYETLFFSLLWPLIDVTLLNFTIQGAQLSLTNRPTIVPSDVQSSLTQNATKHSFPRCAVKSYPHVTDTQTATSPYQMPPYALCRAAKNA